VAAEIDRRIPALLLLREAGLIEKLIVALEEAHSEGRLLNSEQLLMSRLRKLVSTAAPAVVVADPEAMAAKESHGRSATHRLEHLTRPAVPPTHTADGGEHD
jgi:hypothetical protein